MIASFEVVTYFQTYALERNGSFSANCNVLNALLHVSEPYRYLQQIHKTLKYLCSVWSAGKVKDKWVRVSPVNTVQHESFTGSGTSFTQAKEWPRNCRESHPECRSPKSDYYPTRLLYIDSKSQSIRLRHKNSFPVHLQYATLSDCWGQAAVQCLKCDNFTTFEQGIPFIQLAKTFQEAVTVCRSFSCVVFGSIASVFVQDSPGDWEVEALQMWDIYGNSFLNIATTDSKDSHGGLFRERNTKALQHFKLSLADLFPYRRPGEDEETLVKSIKQLEEAPCNRFPGLDGVTELVPDKKASAYLSINCNV